MGNSVRRFRGTSVIGGRDTPGIGPQAMPWEGDGVSSNVAAFGWRWGVWIVGWLCFVGIALVSEVAFAQVSGSNFAASAPAAAPAPAPAASGSSLPAPGFVRLTYSLGKGTAGCDGEVMFRRLVASETNQPDPFVLKGAPTHELDIGIRRDPPGFRTITELRKADGTVLDHHEYAERTCADAVDRAVISVMLVVFPAPAQPKAAEGGAPPAAALKECEECSARVVRGQEEIRDLQEKVSLLVKRVDVLEGASRENRRKKGDMDLSYALSAGALLTANLTSNVGPGVWVAADLRVKVFSVGIELRTVLPSAVFVGKHDLDYSQYLVHITPCGRYSYFFGCVVGGAGFQVMADTNYPSVGPNTGIFPALQLGGRLGVEAPFGDLPVGARLWGEVLYTNPQSSFDYVDSGQSWQRPDVSAFFGLGLVIFLGGKEAT